LGSAGSRMSARLANSRRSADDGLESELPVRSVYADELVAEEVGLGPESPVQDLEHVLGSSQQLSSAHVLCRGSDPPPARPASCAALRTDCPRASRTTRAAQRCRRALGRTPPLASSGRPPPGRLDISEPARVTHTATHPRSFRQDPTAQHAAAGLCACRAAVVGCTRTAGRIMSRRAIWRSSLGSWAEGSRASGSAVSVGQSWHA